jgi:ADP-heptose:LPS heptosyltransferase
VVEGEPLTRDCDRRTGASRRRVGQRIVAFGKFAEFANRRFLIRALSLAMRRRRSAPAWSVRPHDVLFLRPDRVGDMIVSTGLLRAIATSHPTIRLHVLATPGNAGVLEHNPHVASVVVLPRPKRPWSWVSFVRTARRARYDAVIDCKVISPSLTLLLLMLASGARERIGVGGRANDAVYSVPVPAADLHAHNIEQLGALAAAFGVDVATFDWRPEIFVHAAERDAAERLWRLAEGEVNAVDRGALRLLVNVSAGKARCCWPPERYIAVLRAALARRPTLRVLVIGVARDGDALRRIADATGCATARPALRDTFALVESADLLLTPDTGLVHAASAFRTPVVTMCPRGVGGYWGPYRTLSRTVSSAERTLDALPAAPVVAALDELLATVADGASSSPEGRSASPTGGEARGPNGRTSVAS